jgi:hypothetical protein
MAPISAPLQFVHQCDKTGGGGSSALERFRAKWTPVRVKKTRKTRM